MRQAVIEGAGLTGQWHHLSPLAGRHRASVLEDLFRFAVQVDVLAHLPVRRFARPYGDCFAAQRTTDGGDDRLVMVLLHRTLVSLQTKVGSAEGLTTGGALDGQEV